MGAKKTLESTSLVKDISKNAQINNDLKKYQNDPVVVKKMERAIETIKKLKNLSQYI